ncbi:MAG: hypothetical protein IKJ35_03975 [Clostridia bacterium]|nr:hypothetical protein [Clostridia bacterium]
MGKLFEKSSPTPPQKPLSHGYQRNCGSVRSTLIGMKKLPKRTNKKSPRSFFQKSSGKDGGVGEEKLLPQRNFPYTATKTKKGCFYHV